MIKLNVGSADSVFRVIVGVVLIAMVFYGPKSAWGWIGLVPLVTGLFRFCPLYGICKFSTRNEDK